MELDQPDSVTVPLESGGALQQVVVPPLMNPREDVKGGWGYSDPCCIAASYDSDCFAPGCEPFWQTTFKGLCSI